MHLPLVQKHADRTIDDAPRLGRWKSCRSAPSVHRLRAENEERPSQSLHHAGAWRAREPPLAVSRARAVTRACSREEKFGLRRSCSLPKASVQSLEAKRNSLAVTQNLKCERGRANVLSLSRSRPSRAGQTDT